ncbi:hypothetical protein BDW60DRAFT_225244 [Aspergillus nidulans var. acristatus]|jgi:uncharacterized protein YukJ
MPLDNYGVWKAHPVRYHVERRGTRKPHLLLYHRDNGGGDSESAINIKSGDRQESRLVYWVDEEISDRRLIERLAHLRTGYHSLDDVEPDSPDDIRLDYIRRNLFDIHTGRVLPHDIPGPNNDIIDVLEPRIKAAIDQGATVHIFGERYNSQDGMHNIHMNQGNIAMYSGDDGPFQDGALVFYFPESHQWLGVFLAFASQSVHTGNGSGHAISRVTWKDVLLDDLVENSVAIRGAVVNPPASENQRQSVTLANLMNRRIPLSGWKVRNSSGAEQVLPRDAVLHPLATEDFDIPNCPLSRDDDAITLLDGDGLKIAGVRYNSRHGTTQDNPMIFARS